MLNNLARLRNEGTSAWNSWRSAHPEAVPQLEGVYFEAQDLRTVNLCGANLRKSNFSGANLGSAGLASANLSDCSLAGANLSNADLECARLLRANLLFANLHQAALDRTDFEKANIGWTVFADTDLSASKNLVTVEHSGPSTIGIDTLFHSQGKIPIEFLRGAGVPEQFLTYMRSLTAHPIEFYSCFISYSSKDTSFATQLHAQLQAQGVRCWKDSEDLKIGDKFQEEIESAIRLHDKLLIILSENSVNSAWVEREVQAAFEKERKQQSSVLFPLRLDDAVMDAAQAWAADVRRTRHISDFRKWKHQDFFQASFDRLLRDLKSAK